MTQPPRFPDSHLDILERAVIATVSTIRHKDGLISTNPVTFDWDGETIRFSTLKQREKYRNLLANPLLTFCVLSPGDTTRYLEVRGHALVEDDHGEVFQRALWKKRTGQDDFNFDPPGAERVIVTIVPEQISAPLLYGGQMAKHVPKDVV